MKLSVEAKKMLEKEIEKEVEKRINDYPIRVFLDGMEVDIDDEDMAGGEINIFIGTPLFYAEADANYKLIKGD